MKKLCTVHIIRTAEYSDTDFQALMNVLHAVNGQIEFVAGDVFEIPQTSYVDRWFQGFHFEGYVWSSFFLTMAQFRKQAKIAPDEYVCLLTTLPNVLKWFGALDDKEKNNFFVDAKRLSKYSPEVEKGNLSPHAVAYQIGASLLRKQMDFDARDYRYFAHKTPSGCVNDLCLDKRDIQLKLQSAKICPSCAAKLKAANANALMLGHIQAIFRHVQDFLCNNQAVTNLYTLSRLTFDVDKNILLQDYGVILPFTNQQKALYLLILGCEKGMYCSEIKEHREALRAIYKMIGGTEVKNADRIIDDRDFLAVIMCQIKKNIYDTIGNLPKEIVDNYLISSSGRRRIPLDRKLVDLPQPMRALFHYFHCP